MMVALPRPAPAPPPSVRRSDRRFGAALGLDVGPEHRVPRRGSPERKLGGVSGGVAHAPGRPEVRLGRVWVSGGRERAGVEAGVDVLQEQGRGHIVQGESDYVILLLLLLRPPQLS